METCGAIQKSGQAAHKHRRFAALPLAILVVATVLPFLPALRYGPVYDDDVQVVQNIVARSSQSPGTYFVSSVWTLRNSAIQLNQNYYRPLFQSWLRLNVLLFGNNLFWWHFAAICLHLCVTVLVFFLIRRHVANPSMALIGALVFGVHPVHIESVVWLSGATDVLMALGVLGSFLLWAKAFETLTTWPLVGSLVCYLGALFSKETAIALPVIVFGYVCFGIGEREDAAAGAGRRVMRAIRTILPFAAVTIVYLAIRIAVLHGFQAGARPWLRESQGLLNAPAVFVFYLRQFVWPVTLRLYYEFPLVSSARALRFWAPLIGTMALAAGAFLWSRIRRDGTIPAACAWLVVPLLPVLNIAIFYRDDFVHDRYLYLPTVGVAIFCSAAASAIWGASTIGDARPSGSRRIFCLASVTLLIGSLAGLTLTESMPWKDNLSLYSRAAQNSTNSMARMNLATEYARLGRFEDAKELLGPVVQERPDYWLANYNLGYVDYRMKDLQSAQEFLDRSIAQNPKESDAYLYRGLVSFRKERTDEAILFLRRAIALNPRGENYHFALGMVLARQNPEAAKSELREELKYHPASGLVKMQLDGLERAKATATTAGATEAAKK